MGLGGLQAVLGLVLGLAAPAHAAPRTVHIGYQKYGTLVFEKARGTLEKSLAPLGVTVTWTEFLGGPALLEAMGAGSIDFGITGDTPPIFAQAAGVDLVYAAVEPPSPHGEAVIALASSPIHGIADLKGRRIALNKGSNVHNLLVHVLAEAGLTISDVQPVYLAPSDARAAFESGSVDAWAIWDPYLAAAQTSLPTRLIADGQVPDGRIVDENRQYFLAAHDFAASNKPVLDRILQDLKTTESFASGHRQEMVGILANSMRMDPKAVQRAIDRLVFGVSPMTQANFASQQAIADSFEKLGLIPSHVDVAQARI